MPAANAFAKICPSRSVLARIGEKWAVLVLVSLSGGARRFGELRRSLEGVSQKMLTKTLRNLERDGLIKRTLFDERPLRVEYELTAIGRSLLPIMEALKVWAEAHLTQIERSQSTYDARHS